MTQPQNPKHIIVACTETPGDVLLALPVFQTLRASFPQARLTALIHPSAKAMVQGHPAIDAIETVEKKEGIFKLAGRFRKTGADVIITLFPNPKVVLAAWLAKIPTRVGPALRWHGMFQTDTVRMNRLVCDRNEVEYNFEMLEPLGITQFAKKIEFPINGVDKNLAVDYLKEKGIAPGVPYVVVHPGAAKSVLNWKAEKYAQMVSHLSLIKGLRVVITGGTHEGELVSQVTAYLFSLPPEQKPVVITGELGLKPLAAVYQGAICFLSGSTGLMHLAAAVGTPTVSLFSPTPESTPVRWGPWGNEATILIPENLVCPSCQVGYCKKHDTMDALSVPQVFQPMEKYIRKAIPQ